MEAWQAELSLVKRDINAQFAELTTQQDAAKIEYLQIKQNIAMQRRKMTSVTLAIEKRLADVRQLIKARNLAWDERRDKHLIRTLWDLVDQAEVSGEMARDWQQALTALRDEKNNWKNTDLLDEPSVRGQLAGATEDIAQRLREYNEEEEDPNMWSNHYTNQDGI